MASKNGISFADAIRECHCLVTNDLVKHDPKYVLGIVEAHGGPDAHPFLRKAYDAAQQVLIPVAAES